jgi:hypothetical protein
MNGKLGINLLMMLFCVFFLGPGLVLGEESEASLVKEYENLSGHPDLLQVPSKATLKITKNPQKIPISARLMSISELISELSDKAKSYAWQRGSPSPQDYSEIKDTMALLVDMDYSELVDNNKLTWHPELRGISCIHRLVAKHGEFNKSDFHKTFPLFVACTNPKVDVLRNDLTGLYFGFLLSGTGKVTYVWLIPTIKADYTFLWSGHESRPIAEVVLSVDSDSNKEKAH